MTRARERVGYVLRRAIADKKAKRERLNNHDGKDPLISGMKQKDNGKAGKPTTAAMTIKDSGLPTLKSPDAVTVAATKVVTNNRRRKLPIGGLTRKSSASSVSSSTSDGTPTSQKRRRMSLPTGNVPSAVSKKMTSPTYSSSPKEALTTNS